MARLCQVIAIEKGAKSENTSVVSDLYKKIQKPDLFNGFSKNYRKANEEGEDLPPENKKIVTTVPEVLEQLRTSNEDYWAIAARKEYSNCNAKANIIVDGQVLAEGVPVTYLLFLEKQLTDLRTFIGKLPVLDNNEDWREDVNSGLYKTDAISTHRTKKSQKPIVLYPATEQHPAQTEMITEDILAGYWDMVKMSGAMPIPARNKMSDRVNKLLRAVKEAREAANGLDETITGSVEKSLLGFVFGE